MEILLKHFFDYKILIIDDLTSMRENLDAVLKGLGFKFIDHAKDGLEALNLAKENSRLNEPYQLIFCDINMPVMDGLTLLKMLRSMDSYAKTPIVMVSTENEKDTIVISVVYGATDYILKPCDKEILKKKLINILYKQ